MTTTLISGAADLPEAGCSKHHLIHCSQCRHDNMVRDLRAENDRLTTQLAALAAGRATAAQQGVAYAALPEPYCNAHDDADACYPDMFSEQQMRAFADATHTLRASHGEAPAKTGNSVSAQADSVQEDAARYRWLREGNDVQHGAAWHVAVNLYGREWDAAIDAAIKQGANHDR